MTGKKSIKDGSKLSVLNTSLNGILQKSEIGKAEGKLVSVENVGEGISRLRL